MSVHSLEPSAVWSNFLAICGIPHQSEHEEAIGDWLLLRARSFGLEAERDPVGNVLIKKPASPGCELSPGLILQAHMDMVCQARTSVVFDFLTQPIRPYIPTDTPDWVYAKDTTLGADNGIGMAAILALLESKTLKHGPIEALFTVNEESGMTGARGLSGTWLHGSILLNLDSENLEELTIGCAGALRCISTLSLNPEAAKPAMRWYCISVDGLQGGHSGIDIHKGRANANRLLGRLLKAAPPSLQLAAWSGGNAYNAIPREAWAVVAVPAVDEVFFQSSIEAKAAGLKAELGNNEPGFALHIDSSVAAELLLSALDTARVLQLLNDFPDGLIAMEPDMPELVRTSLNLGMLNLTTPRPGVIDVVFSMMLRSSSEADKNSLASRLEEQGKAFGARLERCNDNPAWQPEPGNPLVKTAAKVYREHFGREPVITSTHGGLECGLFRPLYPNWQMISFGPNIRFPHSPDEAVNIPSVAQFWDYFCKLVESLARP